MSELARHLRRTTEQMASFCSVDMALWNEHANACLDSANAVERLASERDTLRAELAAERKEKFAALDDFNQRICQEIASRDKAISDRDTLRAELAAERERVKYLEGLVARQKAAIKSLAGPDAAIPDIDAMLNEGGGDE